MLRISLVISILLGLSCEPSAPGTCCKVCSSQSQACGDSCISNDKQCNAGFGCACNRREFDGDDSSGSGSEG